MAEESRILRERGEEILNRELNNTYLPTLMEDSNYFLGSTATRSLAVARPCHTAAPQRASSERPEE